MQSEYRPWKKEKKIRRHHSPQHGIYFELFWAPWPKRALYPLRRARPPERRAPARPGRDIGTLDKGLKVTRIRGIPRRQSAAMICAALESAGRSRRWRVAKREKKLSKAERKKSRRTCPRIQWATVAWVPSNNAGSRIQLTIRVANVGAAVR